MVVKWIRMFYLIVAWLFPVAILIQVFFVGLSLFTGQAYWSTHRDLGHSLAVLPLLLVILAYLGRLPSAEKRSLCGHPRRRSTPCRLPPRAGSGALCSRPDHRVAGANGGAGGGPNVLHFAGPAFYGRARIFGSRLNEERPFPVLSLRRLLPGKTIATIDGKGNLAYNGSQQKRREARTRASPKDRTDECSTCANENQGALPCTRYALVRALAPARPRCLADPGRPHLDYLLRQPAGVHRSITHCLCWVNVRLPAAYS